MKRNVLVFLTAAIGAAWSSCQDPSHECSNLYPEVLLAGYDSTEIDSLRVTCYEKGSNFTKVIFDTLLLHSWYYHYDGGYAVYIVGPWEYAEYDWTYTLLSSGRTHTVYNVIYNKRFSTDRNHPCFNEIVEAGIDGHTVKTPNGTFIVTLQQ